MTSDHAIRASDHDREHAAEVLRDAYAVGRLSLEEFHDRASNVYSARTWGELCDLTADLPAGQVPARIEPGAGSHTAMAQPGHAPRPRPFAFIWVMALVWLVIAAVVHIGAAAIPFDLLSLSVLASSSLDGASV